MDYTTSVGFGLSQHRAADLARETERRRSVAERLERTAGPRSRPHATATGWRAAGRRLRSPRFVAPAVGIALMGSILGFAALPADEPPVPPAYESPVDLDSGSGGGSAAPYTAN